MTITQVLNRSGDRRIRELYDSLRKEKERN